METTYIKNDTRTDSDFIGKQIASKTSLRSYPKLRKGKYYKILDSEYGGHNFLIEFEGEKLWMKHTYFDKNKIT